MQLGEPLRKRTFGRTAGPERIIVRRHRQEHPRGVDGLRLSFRDPRQLSEPSAMLVLPLHFRFPQLVRPDVLADLPAQVPLIAHVCTCLPNERGRLKKIARMCTTIWVGLGWVGLFRRASGYPAVYRTGPCRTPALALLAIRSGAWRPSPASRSAHDRTGAG